MFKVKVLTYKDVLYSGSATEVVLPSEEGEVVILDFHQPILSRLCRGRITIDKSKTITIKDGIACLINDELRMIVEA